MRVPHPIPSAADPSAAPLLTDLAAEHEALDDLICSFTAGDPWIALTPAAGWSVAHQISHLAFFDRRAALSAVDPEGFALDLRELFAAAPHDPSADAAVLPPAELLTEWRDARLRLVEALVTVEPGRRLDWYGPPMGLRSFATARLMETWAHGQDIADALASERTATARLRHVAHIGVGARAFNLRSNGLKPDDRPVRVELNGVDGVTWTWGPEEAEDFVRGDALDFCLIVTQRRHRSEVDLEVRGKSAETWMSVAQAFAGPPGGGREPGAWRLRGR